MSIHINAKEGEIAKTVLLPGDPLRAQWIANNFLTDVVKYNSVRNMLGFTGTTPDGKRISVQGSGMGMPSLSIYVHELITEFNVENIIRVGSAGSLQEHIPCNTIVLAQSACSDSAMNNRRFQGLNFAPCPNYGLLKQADIIAGKSNVPYHAGNIFSSDTFYEDVEPCNWQLMSKYGVLAVEMEAAALYTLCAKYGRKGLAILTISDNLVTHEKLTSEERETSFEKMVHIAMQL